MRFDLFAARGVDIRENRVHRARVVLGIDAHGVAGLVLDAGVAKVDHHMAGILARALGIERRARLELGHVRVVAGAQRRFFLRLGLRFGRVLLFGRAALGRFLFGHQLLEFAFGFLRARHTAVQVLAFESDGFCIGLAQIAALPAVELGHGGHELALVGLAFRQLHALFHFHARIVPGEGFLGFAAALLGAAERAFPAGQRGDQAVEPFALLGFERRVLGNQIDLCGHVLPRAGALSRVRFKHFRRWTQS